MTVMIPDYQTLMLPVLRSAEHGPIAISDVVEKLTTDFDLTEEERRALLPSGKQTVIANRVHWARSYLKQANLVENIRRGVFCLTIRGSEVLKSGISRIDNHFLEQFPEFNAFKERARESQQKSSVGVESPVSNENETDSPEDLLRRAHRKTVDELKAELIERVQTAPPDFFERLIVRC